MTKIPFINMHFTNRPVEVSEKKSTIWGPEALCARQERLRQNRSRIARRRESWIAKNQYFYRKVKNLFAFIVEPNKAVLNIGCQTGFLLEAVSPARGLGVDISEEMLQEARKLHPEFEFINLSSLKAESAEKFDYIIYSDIGETVDVLKQLKYVKNFCQRHTRLLIYSYNHLWEPLVILAEKLGWKIPEPEKNWLSEHDIKGLLTISGFEWLKTHKIILFPKYFPLLAPLFNSFLARMPLIKSLCMVEVLVARPRFNSLDRSKLSVSVIVPCKNERGNIEQAAKRIPRMGKSTEIIFCDDKSIDGTREEVLRVKKDYPHLDIKLVEGPGICKSKNVWAGFDAASGDILMILDGDLTVMPEELPYFFEVMVNDTAEFVNGSRLIYPVAKGAMKLPNMLGNDFFSRIFSFILDERIKDTLCGTKVLWRLDWQRIKPMVGSWGAHDRWGDYDLLFGASRLNLKITDLPVHYQERIYGTTKMTKVLRHGLIMLKMCYYGYRKLHGRKAY